MKFTADLAWTPPFKHSNGYITDAQGKMVAQMRGWGYLTGTGGLHLNADEASAIQDEMGERIAAALSNVEKD